MRGDLLVDLAFHLGLYLFMLFFATFLVSSQFFVVYGVLPGFRRLWAASGCTRNLEGRGVAGYPEPSKKQNSQVY